MHSVPVGSETRVACDWIKVPLECRLPAIVPGESLGTDGNNQ